MRVLLLALTIAVLTAAATTTAADARGGLSFAQARAAADRAVPRAWVVESCTRLSSARITCDLYRDAAGWRWQRTVSVRMRGGRVRATAGRSRRLCRTSAGPGRCTFPLPRG
jgi:hypothetical protein